MSETNRHCLTFDEWYDDPATQDALPVKARDVTRAAFEAGARSRDYATLRSELAEAKAALEKIANEPASHDSEEPEYSAVLIDRLKSMAQSALEPHHGPESREQVGAAAQDKRIWCPQCGGGVAGDEDGCCATCGADLIRPEVLRAIRCKPAPGRLS